MAPSELLPDGQVLHFIDGQEAGSASGRTFAAVDPATGEETARVAFGTAADVGRAVDAGRAAFDSGRWSAVSPRHRADVLRRVGDLIREHADEIGAIESLDSGKPVGQARAEVRAAADCFTYYAGHAELPNGQVYPADPGHFIYSSRQPYGVVAAISPWNFPLLIACQKAAPALAVGNSVIVKVAEQSPLSAALLGRLAHQAGVPDGVLNVVHGDGPTTGAALVAHPGVPKITFTGSTATGKAIMRASAEYVKSVHLELGGKSPNIVFADGDLAMAVDGSLFTAFMNAGQVCTSGSRLLVQREIAETFIPALLDHARSLVVGHPADPDTQIGPLISGEQHARVAAYVSAGRRDGARLALGGDENPGPGYFMNPVIFLDVDPAMRIAQEEIFGPVLSVILFDDEDEAVRIANGVMYGLAATVWTADLGRAFRISDRLDAGIIWTNCPGYLPLRVPYEGHKLSGLGEDQGLGSLSEFTRLKTHAVGFGGGHARWT